MYKKLKMIQIRNQEGKIILNIEEQKETLINPHYFYNKEDDPQYNRVIKTIKELSDNPLILRKTGKAIWCKKIGVKKIFKIWGENSPPSFSEEWFKIKHVPKGYELQTDFANSQMRLYGRSNYCEWVDVNLGEFRKEVLKKIEQEKREYKLKMKKILDKKLLNPNLSYEDREEILEEYDEQTK